MLSASRNKVAISSSDGKLEKSRARETFIETSTTSTAPVMLQAMRMSSSTGGTGTTSITTIATTPIGTAS